MTTTAVSPTTERSRAFVAAHLAAAVTLGRSAGDLAPDPAACVAVLRDGLAHLADPEYRDGVRNVTPGLTTNLGVRNPLTDAVARGLRATTRQDRPSTLLDIALHLLRDEAAELRWLACPILERTMSAEPERTWQLVRTAARNAGDWITVDTLAHVAARGILAEPYRWAELEQLVYSPSRWERRLAASTVAVIPFADRISGRTSAIAARGLGILGDLCGDQEPDVQKAIAWGLRSLLLVDPTAVTAWIGDEAARAAAADDGHRARVVRDTLSKIPAPVAATLRATLTGIRRHAGTPSTSRAAATAADFLAYGLAIPPAERPVITRS